MNLDIVIDNVGKVRLTDKHYIGAGGEAAIYKHSNLAIKIYHEKRKAIPAEKIHELSKIQAANVCKPLNVVYDKHSDVIGYSMNMLNDSSPLCKLFTKTYRAANNISNSDIVDLVKHMQSTIRDIHSSECLIVDLNEMNLLVGNSNKVPYFIDVDSYQTKSYKATAIMDSIRDPKVQHNNWTCGSDWFSFAILAFQLYIGIHPYKGKHPHYKPNEWMQRMKDGISVFDKNVSLPMICNDLNVIPKRHLDWMKDVFVKNQRSIPPDLDTIIPVQPPTAVKCIKSTSNMTLTDIFICEEKIKRAYSFFGIKWYISQNFIWKEGKKIRLIDNKARTYLCAPVDNISPIVCSYKDRLMKFETMSGIEIFKTEAKSVFESQNGMCSMLGGNLYRYSIRQLNGKDIVTSQPIAMVSDLSSKRMPNLVYQDLLGKAWLTIPTSTGVINTHIKELDGRSILDARFNKGICIVMTEKKGQYDKFVLIFKDTSMEYSIRKIENVNYESINFIVLDNGLCIHVKEDDTIELFRDNATIKEISGTPLNSDMPLFSFGNQVFFLNEKCLTQARMK